jgi:four helix bundle protein
MNYKQFEDLPVWKTAAELYDQMDDFLDIAPPRMRVSFRDQLERATLSVSDNIAEGFERGSTNELLAFLYIARGSAGEVRSMLRVAGRRPYLVNYKSQIAKLITLAQSCSRQLYGWMDSLKDTDIKGQRHYSAKEREVEEGRKRAEECRKKLLRMLPPNHPTRREAEERGII